MYYCNFIFNSEIDFLIIFIIHTTRYKAQLNCGQKKGKKKAQGSGFDQHELVTLTNRGQGYLRLKTGLRGFLRVLLAKNYVSVEQGRGRILPWMGFGCQYHHRLWFPHTFCLSLPLGPGHHRTGGGISREWGCWSVCTCVCAWGRGVIVHFRKLNVFCETLYNRS